MAFVILTTPVDIRPSWYMSLRCKCEMDERICLSLLRITCLCGVVYTTISLSSITVLWALALIGSIFLITPKKILLNVTENPQLPNPLKGKPKTSEEDVSGAILNQIAEDIVKFATYDAADASSLHNFEPIKQHSQCIFARLARIWGSQDWDHSLSLEENVFRTIPTFIKFCHLCQVLGLDGFLYEIPGNVHASNIKDFGEAVRRVMTVFSDHDPKQFHCMEKSYIDRTGWVFQFNRVTFFITTFAPFYPEGHSRYNFGCENGYILFQPEISFAQHDLPNDTPHTNWDKPKTVRDRIRIAFRDAGREYKIRETVSYPMIYDIVKPVDNEENLHEWWRDDQKQK